MHKKCFRDGYKEIATIYAGEYISAKLEQRIVLHTLLGSCIAACLYDEKNSIFGMNHFMLTCENSTDPSSKTAKYGVHAMELLINDMTSKGASRKNLKAKVFGGASPLKSMKSCTVGGDNINFITNFLKVESIPLVSSSVGGEHGRVIYFTPEDYTVYVRKVISTSAEKLTKEQASKWNKAVKSYENKNLQKSELWHK
ncbi:MAG: chemotaxis protein CheD [Denitrovibrio sp.]|nr:MAG: chemotaxis protein CheD [Denitrovibrio sp.]